MSCVLAVGAGPVLSLLIRGNAGRVEYLVPLVAVPTSTSRCVNLDEHFAGLLGISAFLAHFGVWLTAIGVVLCGAPSTLLFRPECKVPINSVDQCLRIADRVDGQAPVVRDSLDSVGNLTVGLSGECRSLCRDE